MTFKKYKRRNIAEMRPYEKGEDLAGVSVSKADSDHGSPKPGDMVARNPKNHDDQWLVSAEYFAENFAPYDGGQPSTAGDVVASILGGLAVDAFTVQELRAAVDALSNNPKHWEVLEALVAASKGDVRLPNLKTLAKH